MALQDFFGKSPQRQNADQALRDAEDRLLAYDDDEGKDLSFHAKKDAGRTQVVVARQRASHALFQQLSDRNFRLTVIIGVALMMKGVISVQDLFDAAKHMVGF